ncbi:Clp protease ClpP [Paenibacillus chitinolyticus]|uniref:head maturation protease, ClpP-related n=1 Tax=Paenibacillus chitinolyticus TaxID=79263 RepID=UPI002DC03902|nr:head maturation protease, ClpP-related [Paenibacillus chitinolyticus]MEC0248895.1 Clp protease ClpP [Paenibacillus chitinolyticus]
MKKRFWEFRNAVNNIGELYVYGEITSSKWEDSETTAQSFNQDLQALGGIRTLNVYINSPGGEVAQGQAIHTILKRHKAHVNVYVDGVAASIASTIAMAGDTIYMPKNTMMMLHLPWTIAMGNATDFRKTADDLEKRTESLIEAYLSKTGESLSREKLIEILEAETWLTAQECFDYGLCDVIVEAKEIAACSDMGILAKFSNVPESLIQTLKKPEPAAMSQEARQKMIEESKANIHKLDQILGGM